METTTFKNGTDAVQESIRGVRDSLSVRRCVGEAQEIEGVTVIPVARIAGGAGGGGGEGQGDDESGSGFGAGFGVGANPLGMYLVEDGKVRFKPAIDVTRILVGLQMLAGLAAIIGARLYVKVRSEAG